MNKPFYILLLYLVFLNSLCLEPQTSSLINQNVELSLQADTVHEIKESVTDQNYLKAEFSAESNELNHYFKYTVSTLPSSRITAFRFEFDQFTDLALEKYQVFCTLVDASTSDTNLIDALRKLDSKTSACIGGFNAAGFYDGIVKYDETKLKLGIYLVSNAGIKYTARVFLRVTEKILGTEETRAIEDESYSLVPYTVVISEFRKLNKSKILFYSYTRQLQMFYAATTTASPDKLFSGNILSVFTNPNMVHQKYHDANTMVLLTNPFGENEMMGERFKFEVRLFDSDFLLDYYVSSNENGRPVNSPLLVNITECKNPYYIILNYNKPEEATNLYIDQIYGKISSIAVATTLSKTTWDEMLENDMEYINTQKRRHVLTGNSKVHMDVYKIECELPMLLNFYYNKNGTETTPLDSGDVSIINLNPYQIVTIPFKNSLIAPEIIIDIFNPDDSPIVIVDDGQNELVYQENSLVKTMPFNVDEGIIIKERAGLSQTRVIVKVGYSILSGWERLSDYVSFNRQLNVYVFEFPNDDKRLNYTYVNLITKGTNSEDNVKYCFTTNIGAALKPSQENCYRVSKDNSYQLKAYNPLIMYKDYKYDPNLIYYITFKPTKDDDTLEITPALVSYNTQERNYEGVNNKVTIPFVEAYSTILTPPEHNDPAIFIQMQVCDNTQSVKNEIINPLDNSQVAPVETISAGTVNYYRRITNNLIENELKITGSENVNVFVKHVGLPTMYTPSFRDSFDIDFDSSINAINIQIPLTNQENFRYTVFVGKSNEITNKGVTLCSFAGMTEPITSYSKTVTSRNVLTSIQINFNKAGMSSGQSFEAIVLAEQLQNSQMVFLSKIIKGTVGEITPESIYEINNVYSIDTDYLYSTVEAERSKMNYYFSYMPEQIFEVPVGSFGIELVQSSSGAFTSVDCAFVDEGADAMTMVEAVEDVIENDNSFCIGSQSTVNSKRYNYVFKYQYNGNKPKKMVIKISNGNYANGQFSIYVKRGDNTKIEKTDYQTQKEYGKDEESKKSVIPYIVDLEYIRGEDQNDYISKILFYSQFLEMQMYYLDEEKNAPVLLFTGNIMLVYTKPLLAEQKYHSTKLILLSENLSGQEHSSLGNSFRFHSKMFKSDAQIEYFVSNNPEGRTLNYPLSLEMNTCSSENNKYYYILNYNKPEEQRTLHLDMIFGSLKSARIVTEINAEKWDTLIDKNMQNIDNYQATLEYKQQHIDIVEIQCVSPLLINVYYNYNNIVYRNLKKGDIAVKNLGVNQSHSITIDPSQSGRFFYSISLFSPLNKPDVTVKFDDGTEHYFNDNIVDTGFLMNTPQNIYITNNANYEVRFIFKIGYGIESEWEEETTAYDGDVFIHDNMIAYRFPNGQNERNFTNVSITVNSLHDNEENVKFCYSTNLGMSIGSSRENCFRTGRFIPYTLTFINPLVVGKNYKTNTNNYYITLTPFEENQYISISVQENKYSAVERNFEDEHNIITLSNGKARTVLTIPEDETSRILVHIQTCTQSSTPISYTDYNAFTGESITSGKVYFEDKNGVIFYTTNTYLENELEFIGGTSAQVYVKHSPVWEYSPAIQDFRTTFDETQNLANMVKPIFDEEFTITVLVAKKGKLADLTLCKLATTEKSHYKDFADYVNTFSSVSSNNIIHFIDFNSIGYTTGTEFDLVVYAEQVQSPKMEFIYPLINGKVGEISGVLEINKIADNETSIVTRDFAFNPQSNYLYYDFKAVPEGKISSVKIQTSQLRVNRLVCVFVKNTASQSEMVSEVNKAMAEGRNACLGESQKDNDGYDALVNSNYKEGNNRLVMQVIYGLSESEKKLGDDSLVTIYLRFKSVSMGVSEDKFGKDEPYGPIPYVIDLLKVRQQIIGQNDYVSKVMFYSSTRELQMFYVDENSPAPVELFSGNIMLVYTNEDVIREKYNGATSMVLITDSLSHTGSPSFGEDFRFKTKYFNSAKTINYFVSGNPEGRLLNNPTSIEMLSCDQPYYYILNYNKVEDTQKELHIDTIFGEITSIKLATALNYNDWDGLVDNMEPIDNAQTLLPLSKFHMDVIEVKCSLPSLLNVFYAEKNSAKTTNLEVGDISILTMSRASTKILEFKPNQKGPFVYSFNIFKDGNEKPKVEIIFVADEDEPEEDSVRYNINENGVYTRDSLSLYYMIIINNKDATGSLNTRVIVKLGYVIESTFQKIQNNIYSNLNDEARTVNLFGYKFTTNEKRLNYTSVDFQVSTTEDNVKFCYSTNLGTYINPSLQNCYRVGKTNSYTIRVLNPHVMYKNYFDDSVINYYVGFRTVNLNQNITITPTLNSYNTTERNVENAKNKFFIDFTGESSTILTAPKNDNPYTFVHIHVCSINTYATYQFLNAYNKTNLGFDGEIRANSKNNFMTINNIKLDTELAVKAKDGTEIFVKHVGVNARYQPIVKEIDCDYDKEKHIINFTQPIENEKFLYTIYIDKIGNLKKQGYTLCSITEVTKLAHYNETILSDEPEIKLELDFTKKDLVDYKDFDVLIIAEQVNNGKLTIMSSVYDSEGNKYDPSHGDSSSEGSNVGLIVIIIILVVVILGVGLAVFLILRNVKKVGQVQSHAVAKATSLAEINGGPNEKLTQSQVDP